MYVRCRFVVFVDVGEYFYQIQQYIAWYFRDADGNEGRPLMTFDVRISLDGVMDLQMANAEITDPPPVI